MQDSISTSISFALDIINTLFVFGLLLYSSQAYHNTQTIYEKNHNTTILQNLKVLEISIFVFFIYTFIQIFYLLLPDIHNTIYIMDNIAFSGLLYMIYVVIKRINKHPEK